MLFPLKMHCQLAKKNKSSFCNKTTFPRNDLFTVPETMSEDWRSVTKEKVEARKNFFTDFFPIWKQKFCQEMGSRDARFLALADKIEWRIDKDGTAYSPVYICSLYFHRYRPRAKHLLMDQDGNLDRHKIVALTQELILKHYPITYSHLKKFHVSAEEIGEQPSSELPSTSVRLLNVSFAYHFAMAFLGAWQKEKHEQILKKPFDADSLFGCFDSTKFACEHHKFLMLDFEHEFPTVLIAQLWFALEQWGLKCVQHP